MPSDHSIEARQATIEADVAGLRRDFSAFGERFDDSTKRQELRMEALSAQIAARDRTPWQTIIPAMGLVIAFLGVLANSWIAPLVTSVAANDEKSTLRHNQQEEEIIAAKAAGIAYTDHKVATVDERMREIETQFGWQRDISYLRAFYADRLDAILWQKVFGTELPQPSLQMAGPVHKNMGAER